MYIYLIFFLLSFLCIYISLKNKNNRKISFIFELLGIILLSFLAAVRDVSIGTDVQAYVKPVFNLFTEYGYNVLSDSYFNIESGYYLFNYIVSIFTNNFSLFLFIVQFFIMWIAFRGIKKLYPENYTIVYAIFVLLFYNRSLNIVRQAMAMSLCIYSLKYVFSSDLKKFLFIIVLAYLFHKTSIIFIIVYFIHMLFKRWRVNKFVLSSSIFITSIILLFYFPNIIEMLVDFNLLSSKYLFYLDNYVNVSLDINYTESFLMMFLILIYLLFYNKYKLDSPKSDLYLILLVINLGCLIISGRYVAAHRLGMYFEIPSLLYFLSSFKKVSKNSSLANPCAIIIAFIFWYCMFVIGNDGNTVPYLSILTK